MYIHIPFCASKCGYCAFYSETACGTSRRRKYLDALKDFLHRADLSVPVETVYLGGGTPNFLTWQELEYLFDFIRKYVPMTPECEISCELNPELLTYDKWKVISQFATRASLGVQSFNRNIRSKLMRRCSERQLKNAFEIIAESPLKHFNIDLIYGISGVQWAEFEEDLRLALNYGVDHISCYALTAEENSLLGLNSPVADDAGAAQWWLDTGDFLAGHGLCRYEISNYARPDGRCRHNENVWRGAALLGAGAAAAGFDGIDRYTFQPDMDGFIQGTAPEKDHIPERLRKLEIFAVNLRTTDGWTQSLWENVDKESWNILQKLCREEAGKNPHQWHIDNKVIKLKEDGLLFWDDIAGEIIGWESRF